MISVPRHGSRELVSDRTSVAEERKKTCWLSCSTAREDKAQTLLEPLPLRRKALALFAVHVRRKVTAVHWTFGRDQQE